MRLVFLTNIEIIISDVSKNAVKIEIVLIHWIESFFSSAVVVSIDQVDAVLVSHLEVFNQLRVVYLHDVAAVVKQNVAVADVLDREELAAHG